MLRKITFALIVSAASLSNALVAEELPTVPAIEVQHPNSARPPLAVAMVRYEEDGMFYEKLTFENQDVAFDMPALNGWVKGGQTPKDSISLFNSKSAGKERLAFALYKSGEFLNSLGEGEARGYANLMQRDHANKLEFLNAEDGFRVKNTFFIFDATYYVVDARKKSAKGKNLRLRHYLIKTANPDFPFVVIRHEGPEKLIEANRSRIERSLMFTYFKKDEKKKPESGIRG